MDIIGKIRVINPEQVVNATFKKRELVVTTEDQYPQHIIIDFTNDKCAILDGYKVGEEVTVSINLRGREYTDKDGNVKYFNGIQAWRIGRTVAGQFAPPAQTPNSSSVDQYETKNNPNQMPKNEDEPDDLPF
jgi:hypothetical protein